MITPRPARVIGLAANARYLRTTGPVRSTGPHCRSGFAIAWRVRTGRGQEIDKQPSREYIHIAQEVHHWMVEHDIR